MTGSIIINCYFFKENYFFLLTIVLIIRKYILGFRLLALFFLGFFFVGFFFLGFVGTSLLLLFSGIRTEGKKGLRPGLLNGFIGKSLLLLLLYLLLLFSGIRTEGKKGLRPGLLNGFIGK
jgi:hypothetical protein